MSKILKYPNPNLIIPSQTVTAELFGSAELEECIKEMKCVLKERKKTALGLAAVQIGIRFSIFILQKDLEIFCNPVVREYIGESYKALEGCLSLEEGKFYEVDRYPGIVLKYQRKNGKEVTRRFSGLEAEVIQHENDHIYGVLVNGAGRKEIKSNIFGDKDENELNEFFKQVKEKEKQNASIAGSSLDADNSL
ncbi:MAG: peptide deformylase [Synergistaceae bacterium]|jgi:peptide deformylase|nr:peptide deformylase [Synergistaceae bacterium]